MVSLKEPMVEIGWLFIRKLGEASRKKFAVIQLYPIEGFQMLRNSNPKLNNQMHLK